MKMISFGLTTSMVEYLRMFDSIKFLFQIFSLRKLNSYWLLWLSMVVSFIEIGIFFIAAGSLEYFLFNKPDGLMSAISMINEYLGIEINLTHILILGCLLAVLSVLLNFVILAVIREKVIQMGVFLQSRILEPYLNLELDFNNERNSKIDLKVFSESLVVIIEGIFLQLYLAISRFLIIIIYIVFGLVLIGANFLLVSLPVALLFACSLVAFSYRIRSLTDKINIIGERRLRILTNFVAGRIDIVFFGLPKLLFSKLEGVLKELLDNKISIMTEVHKPRIVIEGSLILFMIALGIYRIQNPDINLSSLEILSFLLILRLLPALQQFTSNMRAAAASTWAINDLRNLLRDSKLRYLGTDNVSAWNFKIKHNMNSSDWFSIEVTRSDDGIGNNTFLLKPGVVNVIKGPSGAGKSTLLKTIIEALQARDDWNSNLKEMISYLPQDPVSLLTTLKQNILMGKSEDGDFSNEDIDAIGFTRKWVETFDQSVSIDKAIVSGGEAQRIALLRCIYDREKKIFFFDEPTSALDQYLEDRAANLIEAIARRGCFVIVVSHTKLRIDKSYVKEIFI
mgnify:CR=1 FL=1